MKSILAFLTALLYHSKESSHENSQIPIGQE